MKWVSFFSFQIYDWDKISARFDVPPSRKDEACPLVYIVTDFMSGSVVGNKSCKVHLCSIPHDGRWNMFREEGNRKNLLDG
jgi:hypothetical protein